MDRRTMDVFWTKVFRMSTVPKRQQGNIRPFRMAISDQPPVYRSYLLRFWEERGEQPARREWRCSLEAPQTGHLHRFANLTALTDLLSAELAKPAQGPAAGINEE